MRHTVKYLIKRHSFYFFWGGQPAVSWQERLRSCVGAFVDLM
jgi:hypothetical protein